MSERKNCPNKRAVEFDNKELLIIKNLMRMIIKFFPKQTQAHQHAGIIYKKINGQN